MQTVIFMRTIDHANRVFALCCVAMASFVLVGCSKPAETSRASPDRDDYAVEGTGTSQDNLQAVVEPEPVEVVPVETMEFPAEMALESDDLRGGLGRLNAPTAPLKEMIEEPMALESAAASIQPPALSIPSSPTALSKTSAPSTIDRSASMPAGSTKQADEKFARVKVFYATDRAPGAISLSDYQLTGETQLVKTVAGASLALFVIAFICWIRRRPSLGVASTALGVVATAASVGLFVVGRTSIEKHGVTYLGDRGMLTRGVCEVTVPTSHQKGMVERPSLLRFEFREDQDEHIVLTSAVEMQKDDFYKQLSSTVDGSADRDMLVFIHGYNVDFESAVQRTAQIAVDLPFEGVPVCYSWPSQGKLLSYSIDENNALWTVTHLREFLLELARESGADSINVVAHSMGNRAMTMAMQQIQHQSPDGSDPIFDRVVLAAPDVDADRFRRDLAPSLLSVANQVTLYASSDDRALIASKKVHGYPRAGESGVDLVVVPGIETIDVSGIDLSLLGHSYYGDSDSMLRDLYDVVRARLPAPRRPSLIARQAGALTYWQLAKKPARR
jgi:esterase/lipase superfamily enzyme